MTLPDKIKNFLNSANDVRLGYNGINFFNTDNISEGQVGYSIGNGGKSLITDEEGSWQKEWLVIGWETLGGDPIMVDLSLPQFPVLSAMHGEGSWDPFIIADNLDNFNNILVLIKSISRNRTNPVEVQKNPISYDERDTILASIQNENSVTEISYWETFLEND